MCKKIFILFLILCLLTTLIGCRGTPTVPPISPEPEGSFSEDFVLVQVKDPGSNIIFVTGKENEDAMAILGEKDNQGDPTRITGAVYVTEQGDAFYLEAGIDGLPTYIIDSEGNTVIFENYTNSTVDVSIYDSNGNLIQGLTTINIDPSDLLEIKQLYNSFYSKQRWSSKNTADVLNWGAVALELAGCAAHTAAALATYGALAAAAFRSCGSALLSTVATITQNDTLFLMSISVTTYSCIAGDPFACGALTLHIIAEDLDPTPTPIPEVEDDCTIVVVWPCNGICESTVPCEDVVCVIPCNGNGNGTCEDGVIIIPCEDLVTPEGGGQ